MTGGTFSITNVGMFPIDYGTPVINPPQTCICGFGRPKLKPAVLPDGTIDVREYPFRELTYTRGGKGKQAQDIDVEAEVERQMMMDAEPEELAELLSEEKADMMERRMKDNNR